jgi:hypothetical protein
MSDEFELELPDDEFSELKRVCSLLGISPEEGAVMALRDYIRKFEAQQQAQLHVLVAGDENILHLLADEADQ